MSTLTQENSSGNLLITSLPNEWRNVRLKHICTLNYGDSLADEKRIEGDVPVYGSNGVVGKHNKAITTAPCIIVGRKGSYGKVNYATEPCFPIDTTYWVDTNSTKADLRWLFYVLPFLDLDKHSQDSAVPGLSREIAYEKLLPKPPRLEQHRIAAYLDEQTAKIDRLMNMRRRQMALLKEQRAALIQQAVTRGLNQNAPMKDSGLPWLGEIPVHWNVKRGRFLVKQGRSSVKPGPFGTQLKTSDYMDAGIKVLNQETVISGDFNRGNDYITLQKLSELREFEVQPGDLLLTTRGTIGRCATVPANSPQSIIHPCLMRIRFNPIVMTNEYAVAFIEKTKLFLEQVNLLSNATTIEVIYSENFRDVYFPVPPIEEQQEIVAWLRNPNDPILTASNSYARQLTLLAEYRAALIHECVTGQRCIGEDLTPESL